METQRLRLVPGSPALLVALIENPEAFHAAVDFRLADGLRDFFLSDDMPPEWLASVRSQDVASSWEHGYYLVQRDLGLAIGTAAFKGPPDGDGVVEIAYAIVPDFEGQGYATEAAGGLIEYARHSRSVRVVRAHTLSERNASTRVLEKCGFRYVGAVEHPEDGWVWRWELELTEGSLRREPDGRPGMVGTAPLKPTRPLELVLLFGVPTALNALACKVVIPRLDARGNMPIEVAYFFSVGLLVLVPMFVAGLGMSAREARSPRMRDVLARMRVKPIRGRDWVWTVVSFVVLSMASFVIARVVMPRVGMDATPFFFQNMPLSAENRWILAVWPGFFFFNIFGEEFLWRGYIQPRQELLTGRWTWLTHGALWAMWHTPMGLDLIVASFPIFFILPAVVQLRKNTTIAIVVHAVFGAFGFLALALGLVH